MAHRFKVDRGGPHPHFVTLTIIRWQPVFVSGPYFRIILDALEHYRQSRGLAINAYVCMPTHLHAILTALEGDLSAIIRDFKRFTSRAIYEQAEKDNHRLLTWLFRGAVKEPDKAKIKVWQDEFHPEAIYSREFFEQKSNYIHANPVRKGLVDDPAKWYYSSAAAFAGGETGPLGVDWLEW